MANALRDHVFFIDTTATFTGTQQFRTIRWFPGTTASSIVIDRIKQDGTFETVWEDASVAVAATPTAIESHDLQLRCMTGFRITLTGAGTKAYLYEPLDED